MAAMSPELAYTLAYTAVAGATLGAACLPVPSNRQLVQTLSVTAVAIAIAALFRPLGVAGSVAVGLALLVGGASIGATLGARVAHAGYLLPVAVVSALADAVSVLHPAGPSAAIANDSGMAQLLAVPAPVPQLGWVPILGVGDVVFTALYVAAARRHGLGLGRTLTALAAGYAATLVAVVVWQRPLPALPFLGAGLVLLIPETRAIPTAERPAAWSVMLGFGAIALALLAR